MISMARPFSDYPVVGLSCTLGSPEKRNDRWPKMIEMH